MQFSISFVSFLAIIFSAVIVSPFQFMQPKRILPSSREQLLRGQLAYLKGIAIAQEDQYEPFEASLIAKRLRGEPIRFGKRSPREPIRFGKRFAPLSDYDFP